MTETGEKYRWLKRELFDRYSDFLNSDQRKAVFQTEGSLLVLAGAGSGKTTVLVNRVGFIIKYGNASGVVFKFKSPRFSASAIHLSS